MATLLAKNADVLVTMDGGRRELKNAGLYAEDGIIKKVGPTAELHRLTGLDHLATEFGYGGMPHAEAELNMRLFADRVMPVLQRDPAFSGAGGAGAIAPSGAPAERSTGVFAPA